jgi:hypothetical protein
MTRRTATIARLEGQKALTGRQERLLAELKTRAQAERTEDCGCGCIHCPKDHCGWCGKTPNR